MRIETYDFPSPSRGGVRGGGLLLYLTSDLHPPLVSFRLCETTRPPPLAPPHKGEGNEDDHPVVRFVL